MALLSFPYLTAGVGVLVLGAVVALSGRWVRGLAVAAGALSLGCFFLAGREAVGSEREFLSDPFLTWLEVDAFDSVPLVFFAVLSLLMLVAAPKRDVGGSTVAGMLLISAGTQMVYAAGNWVVLAVGWWLTGMPFVLRMFREDGSCRLTSAFILTSGLVLLAGIGLLGHVEFSALSQSGGLPLVLLVLAVVLRKGVFPFHGWVVNVFDRGPLLPAALMFNGHLGAVVVARAQSSVLPAAAQGTLEVLSIAALVTAVVASLRGFAERRPRRLLGLLCVSQASFILSGLVTANTQGITGALVHWLVVAAASTGLVCLVRALEVRVSGIAEPSGNLGLAAKAPRLATFFLLCGLALVGLPGTLGYCAEDLLFHGALKDQPWLGLALPLATAFNAINLIRLYNIIFLGVPAKQVIDIPDALPRERWALVVCVVFLVGGGLFPAQVIRWRERAAQRIGQALGETQRH